MKVVSRCVPPDIAACRLSNRRLCINVRFSRASMQHVHSQRVKVTGSKPNIGIHMGNEARNLKAVQHVHLAV
eukprot:360578-Chlamydomonas_euryale.AAC.10